MLFVSQVLSYKRISGEHNSQKIKTMAQAAKIFTEDAGRRGKEPRRKPWRMMRIAIQ